MTTLMIMRIHLFIKMHKTRFFHTFLYDRIRTCRNRWGLLYVSFPHYFKSSSTGS